MIISSHYLSVWFRSDVVRRNQMQCTPRVMTDWNESRVRWKWSVSFSCYVIVLEVSSQWRYLYHGFSENTLSIGFWLFEVIDMKRFGIFNYPIKWELQKKGFAFGVAEKVWEFDHTFTGIYQSMGDETAKNETKRWNEDAWGEFDQKNLKCAHHLAILLVCWFFRCNWVSCWDSCLSYLHQNMLEKNHQSNSTTLRCQMVRCGKILNVRGRAVPSRESSLMCTAYQSAFFYKLTSPVYHYFLSKRF